MSAQYEMLDQMTYGDTPSVISSPASGSGAMPCDAPDGATSGPSGREVARASRSARRASAKAKQTSATSGPHGFPSSPPASLSWRLANRLRAKTDLLGSTMFSLKWKERVTPAGRSIPALRATAPRISASDCTGWPTPNMPTGGPNFRSTEKHAGGMDLDGAAILAGWPTPRSNQSGHSTGNPDRATDGRARLEDLVFSASLSTDSGGKPIGFLLGRNGWEILPASGQLNPEHSLWLMGLPTEYLSCGVRAMESLRRKPRRSLKR